MYAIANNLIGFKDSSIRVKILATVESPDNKKIAVMTADLLDAGTFLLVDADQLSDFHN